MKNSLYLLPLLGLYILGLSNFLLYHSLIEILSVIIAGLVFLVTFNSRETLDNLFVGILGVGYFFVGSVDLLHVFSYQGLNVFAQGGANLATQLWLTGRFFEVFTIFLALVLVNRRFDYHRVFLVYTAFFSGFLFLIFGTDLFPVAYSQSEGLTTFKVISEYFIITILILCLYLVYRKKRDLNLDVLRYMNYSLFFTIAAELTFTLYGSVDDNLNIIGHLLKLASFYYIYRSVAQVGLREPHKILYRKLNQNKERLARSERKYRKLFSNMNSGFALHELILDKKGEAVDYRFVEVNDSFMKMTGLEGNIEGKKVSEVIPTIKDDRADWIRKYTKVAMGNKDLKFEQYSEVLDKWYSVNAYSPQKGYFVTIFDDITKRKRTEKELNSYISKMEELTSELFKFQLAVEDTSEGVSITDPEGRILYVNPAMEKMTGYTEREMVGNTSLLWGNKLPPESKYCNHSDSNIWKCLPRHENRYEGEVINKHKSGKEFYSYLKISPVLNREKKAIFFVCLERDVTEDKEIDKTKTDFIYFVSHELKTPIASIVLALELLSRSDTGTLNKEQQEYLSDIKSSIDDMTEFIETLLNISRIESNTLFIDREPMNPGIEVKNLVDEFKLDMRRKGLRFKLDFVKPMPIINMDEKIFKLVFRNLISNAIRYTPETGKLRIGIKKIDDKLEIAVCDTGCGIDPAEQELVFDKLYRSKQHSDGKIKGSGLGLYIVKNMIDKTGGDIRLESEPGKGSCFYVRLPIMKV